VPISHRHRALLVHVPKTGGTCILRTLFRDVTRLPGQCAHPHLSEIIKQGGAQLSDYFKFAFVRNPWDRLVSAYHHILEKRRDYQPLLRPYASFTEFARALADKPERFAAIVHLRAQTDFLDGSGPLGGVDFLGRFESFRQDFYYVLRQVGKSPPLVRRRNASRHADYRSFYDTRTREAVGSLYINDCRRFDYDFDRGCQPNWIQRLRRAA